MSLLLKALRQAEQSNASHSHPGETHASGALDLELDPLTKPKREWVEPPGMEESFTHVKKSGEWRWPLGLVPTTALLALLIAVGYGIYLYWMTRPQAWAPPNPPNTAPVVSAPRTPPSAPELPEVPVATPAVTEPARAVEVPQANPETPVAVPAMTAAPAAPPRAKPVRQPVQTVPRKPAAAPTVAVPAPAYHGNYLEQAYAAFQAGQLDEARALYQRSASAGPNTQALLGLAAIAQARGEHSEALRLYQSVLELSPGNAVAQAALIDMLGTSDPAAATARVKGMISREPSSFLFFTLGNLYADQGRWSDAEQAYFEAFQREPVNADYAFNLAVSLEHLKQADAAVRYYETALKLAGPSTRFDRAQALKRVELLK
jgi:Flp pilus assembly protein TadD